MTPALVITRDPEATLPEQATGGAAAYDLCAVEEQMLPAQSWQVVKTGLKMAIPRGCAGLILPRSGLAAKKGITVLNAPGLIDPDYRGEVGVCLMNHGYAPQMIRPGDRIAQLLIVRTEPVMITEGTLSNTERGAGGWGSTGA